MATTLDELESFHRFAAGKLSNGGANLTLEDCLRLWRADCDEAETVELIKRGAADIEAGRHHTLGEVDAEIRRRLDQLGQSESA